MKRKVRTAISLILCGFVLMSLFGCSSLKGSETLLAGYERSASIPVYDFTSADTAKPEGYDSFCEGIEEVSFTLLSELSDDEENIVISPYSLISSLAMVTNGTSDNTRTQLRKTLFSGEDTSVINEGSYYLSSRLSAFNSKEGYLKSANSLWFNDEFDVKSQFLQTVKNYYDAEVMRVPFEDGSSVDKINSWVSSNTDGEIPELLKELDADAMAVIINTVLMEDVWSTEYEDSDIHEGTFNGTKGTQDATYMTSTEAYISSIYAEGFIKNFRNTPLRFAAFMPKEDISIGEFMESFTQSRYETLIASQTATDTCVATIPQFEIRTRVDDLSESLKDMGITDAFDPDKADFSNLTNTGDVYLSQVVQEAFVQIGPKGAKAGAATASVMNTMSLPPEDEIKLNFDRPFVFVIYDNESAVPVFIGVVNNL